MAQAAIAQAAAVRAKLAKVAIMKLRIVLFSSLLSFQADVIAHIRLRYCTNSRPCL
jgi:hypothetical protein